MSESTVPVSSHAKPRPERLYIELLCIEVMFVDRGYLELPSCRRLYGSGNVCRTGRIEVQAYHGKVAAGRLRFFFDMHRISLCIKVYDTIARWVADVVAEYCGTAIASVGCRLMEHGTEALAVKYVVAKY